MTLTTGLATEAPRRAAIGIAGFSALSAVVGGITLLLGVLPIPIELLRGSVFTSFAVPALILTLVIGGTQAVAFVTVLTCRSSGAVWSAVAGFGLIIWIMVETVILRGFSVLQGIYFVAGVGQVAVVLLMLGIVRRPVSP